MNREALSKVAALVKPAIATQSYIPALQHIRFDGFHATAYNDITAIMVRIDTDFNACLPGDLLIRALDSFRADTIAFQEGKDHSLVMSSGRAKLKIPTLDNDAFPFEFPNITKATKIPLGRSIMKGIELCLLAVGTDTTHPAQMGVTLDIDSDNAAVLFSTDNFTMSRFGTNQLIKLPGDTPIIMPTFFCQQLVTLAKAFPEDKINLFPVAGALAVEIGSALLFSKTLVDLEPLDFPKFFAKHCKLDGLSERLFRIPDNWDAAFERAMLVLGGEYQKTTKVTLSDDSIRLHSSSTRGDSDDIVATEVAPDRDNAPDGSFYLDPAQVLRISKVCGLMCWNYKALTLADADAQFIHLISYCQK